MKERRAQVLSIAFEVMPLRRELRFPLEPADGLFEVLQKERGCLLLLGGMQRADAFDHRAASAC